MAIHNVNGKEILDWKAFHDFFAKEFDFPDYYGRNMDAWIDCMSDPIEESIITLLIHNAKHLKTMNQEIYDALIECSAFVNWRFVEEGGNPVLAIAFHE